MSLKQKATKSLRRQMLQWRVFSNWEAIRPSATCFYQAQTRRLTMKLRMLT